VIFTRLDFDELGSTNTEAAARAKAGAPEGLIVTTKCQTSGRGRQGRRWQGGRGNLYMSLVLRPALPVRMFGQISFVASLSLAEVLESYGLAVQLKWPNDILVNGAKIAGILPETEQNWLVLGIGLNVMETPQVEGRVVTSLAEEGAVVPTEDVLLALQQKLLHWYDAWQRDGFPSVRAAWLARATGMGQRVEVVLAEGQKVCGVMEALDDEGALIVRDDENRPQRIFSGEVFFA